MIQQALPYLYFPSNVFLLDDNQRFLDALVLQLSSFSCRTCCDPQAALKLLQANEPEALLKTQAIRSIDENDSDQWQMKLNGIKQQRSVQNNPKRFETISVVVADYAMPSLNGIDFFKSLPNKHFKKIMLTGEADDATAIKALNDDLIDKFIPKHSNDQGDQLKQAITTLQNQFFCDHSQAIADFIPPDTHLLLQSEGFQTFFKDFLHQHGGVEYYLMDQLGSFLCSDADARPFWLILKNKEELEALAAVVSDVSGSSDHVEALSNGTQLPLFTCDNDRFESPEDWHYFPAQPLPKQADYVYAIVPPEAMSQ